MKAFQGQFGLREQDVRLRRATNRMIDEKARVALQVPTMEKVGPLRQSMAPENGKAYWMVFSNKGNMVRKGPGTGPKPSELCAEVRAKKAKPS